MTGPRFANAAVLVTGAAQGFGRLAAERFAREGARLALCDLDVAGLAEAAAACRALGAPVAVLPGDVGEEATARDLVALCLARFGRLDAALNNAGIANPLAKLPDIPSAEAERVLRVNLFGVFLALKHQLPVMAAQGGGAILNVASVAGLVGAPLMAVYAAAKHGVIGLTKSAALEYARKNVRVNAICPAFSATPMVQGLLDAMGGGSVAALARVLAAVPMQRLAEPAEVVEAMLWMLSPANSFMTGHALALDGGLSAG